MPLQKSTELLYTLLVGGVELGVFILIVVLAVLDRRSFAKHWKRGLVIGLVVFAMLVPMAVYSIAYFDPVKIARRTSSSMPDQGVMIALYIGLIVGIGIRVLGIGWHMVVYCVAVAEWERLRLSPFPLIGADSDAPLRQGDGEVDGSAGGPVGEQLRAHADGCGPPNAFGEQTAGSSALPSLSTVHEAGAGSDVVAPDGQDDWPVSLTAGEPVPKRSRAARGGVVTAALFGAVAGVASVFAFEALDVEESESLKRILETMFPDIKSASLWVSLPVILLFSAAAAVAEELSYRGVVMGFIQRLSPRSRSMATAAVVVSAFLWAALHLNMTNAPATKFIQIFALGIAFAWFARRYCIEAAIAAHLALNVTAVVVGMCVL